jgi:hypothetical protein
MMVGAMREQQSPREPPLFATTVADSGHSDAAVAVPRAPLLPRIALPQAPIRWQRIGARAALAALLAGCAALLAFGVLGAPAFVWHSGSAFPAWMAGPLHSLLPATRPQGQAPSLYFAGVSVAMLFAYAVALLYARSLSTKAIWAFVLASQALLVLGPPLQGTDIFNYIGYARLGVLHGLNPYTHVIAAESHDPAALLATWLNWRDPYGPLFTALTYPLGLLPLPAAYWALKAATVALALALVWIVGRCARLTGRDPRWAMLLVAANPLFLIDVVGGFHNDLFMMVPAMGAIALLLAGRDREAGAALAVAVAVKFTAVLILPFMLVAARPPRRRGRLLSGFVLAVIPLAAISFALFGLALPNVAGQSQMLTSFSIANLLGWALGFGGGAPGLLEALEVCVVLVIAQQLLRKGDWLAGAGWSTAALIASLGSLWPWYLVWLLPLTALAQSARLRRVTLALTVFLALTSIPYTGQLLAAHGVNPLASPVGRAALTLAAKYAR